jgi:hypothetical protein
MREWMVETGVANEKQTLFFFSVYDRPQEFQTQRDEEE